MAGSWSLLTAVPTKGPVRPTEGWLLGSKES